MFKSIVILAVLAVLATLASAQYYYGGYGTYGAYAPAYGYGYSSYAYPSVGYSGYYPGYYLKK